MYLKTTTIKNFQSHKHSVIHWHKGVNIIIGLTDAGKSVINRAHSWVIKNRSEDKGFRSKWGGKTDVEMIFTDGVEVSRVQDEKNHYYLVDPVTNTDEVYTAFKTDIPEDITKALNLSSINLKSQFDTPFLLGENSGDVAKQLNEIANLTDIDSSISSIRKLVLSNSKEISNTELQITELEEKVKSFEYLDQMEKDVNEWEKLNSKELQCDADFFALGMLLSNIEKNQKELNEIDSFLKAEVRLNEALTLIEEEKQVSGQVLALDSCILKLEANQTKLNSINEFLKVESELQKGLQLIEELRQVEKEYEQISSIILNITRSQNLLEIKKKYSEQAEIEFKKAFPKICPLCNK